MKKFLLMLSLAGAAVCARAEATNLPVKIGAAQAAQHFDEILTVTGQVAQVSLRPTIVFINLDQPYPDSPLAAVIHSSDTNHFGNLKLLKGQAVEITGKVEKYHDRPEIVLKNSNQLLVLTNGVPAPYANPAAAPPARSTGTNDLTTGVM